VNFANSNRKGARESQPLDSHAPAFCECRICHREPATGLKGCRSLINEYLKRHRAKQAAEKATSQPVAAQPARSKSMAAPRPAAATSASAVPPKRSYSSLPGSGLKSAKMRPSMALSQASARHSSHAAAATAPKPTSSRTLRQPTSPPSFPASQPLFACRTGRCV
jgi:hypothetical protein